MEQVVFSDFHGDAVGDELVLGKDLVEEAREDVALLVEVSVVAGGTDVFGGVALGMGGFLADFLVFLEGAEEVEELGEVDLVVEIAVVRFE